MITRYRVWLDGQGLQDLDPRIIVSDIQELSPDMDVQTVSRAIGDGMRVLKRRRRTLTVAVRFYIDEYDTARRKAIMQKVVGWACKGGKLSISDRPDQYLQVETDLLPALTSAQQWLGEQIVSFVAYGMPYWQEVHPVTASASGKTGKVYLSPPGDRDTVLEATITNRGGGVLTDVQIALNGAEIRLSGLSVAVGDKVSIAMQDGLLTLPVAFRTAESSDELTVMAGKRNEVSFTADQDVQAVFSARGAWM